MSQAANLPRPKNASRQIFVWLFGLGVLLVVALMIMALAPSGKAGSSLDRSPWGSREFFQYLQEQGTQTSSVQRWQRAYKNLSGRNQVLFQITDQQRWQDPWSLDPDIEKWLAQGNTLIRFTWGGTVRSPTSQTRLSTPQGPVAVDTRRRMNVADESENVDLGPAITVLGDDAGAVAWSVKTKAGGKIFGVYPWLVANAYSGLNSANFAYFAALAQAKGEKIWFDEWLHGYRIKDSEDSSQNSYGSIWDYLRRTPWLLVLIQAIVLGLILLWGKNHRLGPLIQAHEPTQANSEQYIQALSGVLHQAQHHDFVQAQLSQRCRQELAEKLGLRGAWSGHQQIVTDQELAQAWSLHTGEDPGKVLLVLGPVPEKLSEQELLIWLNQVGKILQGLVS
ncbi:DUF4350 domain-containing protein [Thermosynechococcaceae cyanobacterium BACA0444]|uniref:DUF4350 domain-containing protein n=1 Tax=Pseudocalidococcus azoricus BACA0444 TaxID=2918990 RepID=A0AAE4FRT0_9CYAN|nr:DUF4350 domain-containing protein [Pseudocalidococcus azoricus]MDS3859840.1 DUF4350 domain-containing protein [Pseudocalidococcus azoricus BACA0444]